MQGWGLGILDYRDEVKCQEIQEYRNGCEDLGKGDVKMRETVQGCRDKVRGCGM